MMLGPALMHSMDTMDVHKAYHALERTGMVREVRILVVDDHFAGRTAIDRIIESARFHSRICDIYSGHDFPCEWIKWSAMSRRELQAREPWPPIPPAPRPCNPRNAMLDIRRFYPRRDR